MSSEQVQHFASFFFAIGFDAVSENDLVARLVHTLFESKAAALFGLLQSPSGENSRDLSDIFLSVAAVDSERVQFHKLAPIVFIQAGTPSLALLYNQRTVSCAPSIAFRHSVRNIGVRSHAQPIVQIEQHRRTLRSRDQQVLKFSQRMRANHVPLIAGQQVAVGALADEYVEVVGPNVKRFSACIARFCSGIWELEVSLSFLARAICAHSADAASASASARASCWNFERMGEGLDRTTRSLELLNNQQLLTLI